MRAALVYPHQLYAKHPALEGATHAVLVEDSLFFRQYRFHRQKLLLHRASMQSYAAKLREHGRQVRIVEAIELDESSQISRILAEMKVRSVRYVDPCDDWLSQRLSRGLAQSGIGAEVLEDPVFLTPRAEIEAFVSGRDESRFFTSFYMAQRKRLGVLLDDHGKPVGGKWSLDRANRKRLPRQFPVPGLPRHNESGDISVARRYVRKRFPNALVLQRRAR